VTEKFNGLMRRLVLKCREAETLLQTVGAKVTDNYDLFKHESKTKELICKLKNEVKDKERELDGLQSKLDDM
jgi:hypothetical protein